MSSTLELDEVFHVTYSIYSLKHQIKNSYYNKERDEV